MNLLFVFVVVAALVICDAFAADVQWSVGASPRGERAPIVVQVAHAHVARWTSASRSVYGLTKVGASTFMVSSVTYERNHHASNLNVQPFCATCGVQKWASLAQNPELRVSPESAWTPGTRSFVVRFARNFTAKRGGPAKVLANAQPKCASKKLVFSSGADADHYVVRSTTHASVSSAAVATGLRACAVALVAAYPEIVHATPVRAHKAHTAYAAGPAEVLSGGIVETDSSTVGAGLVRAVMDLDEIDTTHCFFYDSANPVLYTSVASVPTKIAPTSHSKFAGVVSVCTDNPAVCNTQVSSGSPQDTHATHVSGIAAGFQCGMHQGVAPASKLLVLAIPGVPNVPGALDLPSNLFPALQTAAWSNASSLTISFGGPPDGFYDDTAAQIDAFVSFSGAVVTVSAGNAGSGKLLSSPAVARNVLSVGASLLPPAVYASRGVASFGVGANEFSVADFSSDGALVCAPGVGIVSSLADPAAGPGHATFVSLDGTSMAAPMVPVQAAQQALARYGFSKAPAALVRALIVASAVPSTSVVDTSNRVLLSGGDTPSDKCTFGVPHLTENLVQGSDASWVFITESAGPQRFSACFSSTGTDGNVNATLVWDEPPHVPGWPDPIYTPLELFVSAPMSSAFASDASITQNHKRVGVHFSGSSLLRVSVVNPHAESAESGEPTPAPVAFREYEFVQGYTFAVQHAVPFALAIRGPSALTQVSSSLCGVCSPQEPPVPCAVANGTGEAACLANGSGFAACLAVACDAGFVLSKHAGVCVAANSADNAEHALCPAPLAWNGTACVCLTPTMQCVDGSFVACDANLGLGGCPATPGVLWVAGENATLAAKAAAATLSALEYENPVETPEYNLGLAIGAGIASAWVAVSFLVCLLGAGYARKWRAPLDLPTNQFAAFAALVGFTGCVCAAVAAPILVVWILLVLYMLLCVWHILIAREATLSKAKQCVTRDTGFWIVFVFAVTEIIVAGVIYMVYSEIQFPNGFTPSAIIFGLILAGAFLGALHASDAAAFVLLVLLFFALLSATISLGVQAQWTGFWLLLVATICVFVLVFVMANAQCVFQDLEDEKDEKEHHKEKEKEHHKQQQYKELPGGLSAPLLGPADKPLMATTTSSIAATRPRPIVSVGRGV